MELGAVFAFRGLGAVLQVMFAVFAPRWSLTADAAEYDPVRGRSARTARNHLDHEAHRTDSQDSA
ncbi:hypothetical protein DL991_31110 [Amycolatopsis sp. WAC 01375]|nr:hypothetical protein DL991_31110 [Amycolatopsis sp. WAC 01375]